VNLLIALSAAAIASWFARNPVWLAVQRYLMGFVLAGRPAAHGLCRRSPGVWNFPDMRRNN
jgi:hypothetical protein